jgi:quercetin dioxygenase-like cupin family protein
MQHWNLAEIAAPEGMRDPTVLHSDEGARAVLVVLTAGQSLGDHQVKEIAWLTVVSGHATVVVGGERIEATTGALFRFEPAERHSVSTETGARLLLILAPWPGQGHYQPGS